MKSIHSPVFWNAIACKLVEQLISVKMWVMVFAAILVWRLFSIVQEIKQITFRLLEGGLAVTAEGMAEILTAWFGKILDITLAFFTAVIVVILLSREVFKHAKIGNGKEEEEKTGEVEKIQSEML